MTDNDDPKKPKLVSLSDKRKARAKAEDDEFLSGLSQRLLERAEAAQQAGDEEMAIEMRAASAAVDAADFLSMALMAMDMAHDEWDSLKELKKK